MAKKKKKKSGNKTLKSLVLLICVFGLVWLISSCGQNVPIPSSKDNNLSEEERNTEDNVVDSGGKNDTLEEEEPEEVEEPEEEITEPEEPEEVEEPEGSGFQDDFDMDVDAATLSNETKGWWFVRNTEHLQPSAQNDMDIAQYGAYYKVDTGEKVFYLTLDAGYENGYTETILDTLKENNVQALFFLTKSYIRDNPELTTRMKQDGHLVGNHSVTHPSMPTLTDEELIIELEETARYFEEVTGFKMDPFFRPPRGEYSERTLYLTRKLGYRTIFWSLTYKDWDVNKQEGKEYAYNHVIENFHPGAIALLHAVSSSNTEAMDDIIKTLKEEGYRFGNLYEIE